ncbi:MAG: glycine cleavage T C-terminal barrel domain-containing protein [Actinomycetota bacterium]
MGRFVDLAKADFVGRDALLREAEDGAARTRLTGLVVDRAALARLADAHDVPTMVPARVSYYPMKVLAGDRGAGRATSITWSPTLHAIIAFGHLDQQAASPGTKVEVSWRHEGTEHPVPATTVPLPFLDLRRS